MSFDITTRVESPGTEIVDASEDNTVPDASQSVVVISAESDPSIFAIIKVFTFNTLLELLLILIFLFIATALTYG